MTYYPHIYEDNSTTINFWLQASYSSSYAAFALNQAPAPLHPHPSFFAQAQLLFATMLPAFQKIIYKKIKLGTFAGILGAEKSKNFYQKQLAKEYQTIYFQQEPCSSTQAQIQHSRLFKINWHASSLHHLLTKRGSKGFTYQAINTVIWIRFSHRYAGAHVKTDTGFATVQSRCRTR